MFVYKRMAKNPVYVNKGVSILDAMEVMRVSNVKRLPIVDGNDRLVGIVTSRDLHMASPSPVTTLSKYEANYLLQKITVGEVMSGNLLTVKAKATIEEVALLMYKNKIGAIPVVEDDDPGKLVGIITETDIFKILVDVMGLPEGKTRITATFHDRMGMLADVGAIFKELGQNITSFAIVNEEGDSREIVIRGDFVNIDEIKSRMRERGFAVTNVTHIN
jgi:acetoin utilization protein AcuB